MQPTADETQQCRQKNLSMKRRSVDETSHCRRNAVAASTKRFVNETSFDESIATELGWRSGCQGKKLRGRLSGRASKTAGRRLPGAQGQVRGVPGTVR